MYGSKMKSEETDHLFEAILSLKDLEECYRFFDDLCTFSEIQAMTQRLQVAEMLGAGNTFSQISKEIGVSSATITRVNPMSRQYGRTFCSIHVATPFFRSSGRTE